MGKVLKFPTGGKASVDRAANNRHRTLVLEQRLLELEQRTEVYREDIEYIGECLLADTDEMSQILGELASLTGFDSMKPMGDLEIETDDMPLSVKFTPDPALADSLNKLLGRDTEGDDYEDR